MDKDTLRLRFSNVVRVSDGELQLLETGNDATLREVIVTGLPDDAYAVKIDPIKVQKLFSCEKDWAYNKHGDYLIVTDNELIVVEMKSKMDLTDDVVNDVKLKFKSDTCILNYCDSVFRVMLEKNPFFGSKPTYFVLFYQKLPIQKLTTVPPVLPPAPPQHLKPDAFARLQVANGEKVNVKRLLRGI
ncbi:MAG: hypothetical protein K2I09_07295 [Duncaniella sp.]|nr:hypothetical protein [Duncaniella sp.]